MRCVDAAYRVSIQIQSNNNSISIERIVCSQQARTIIYPVNEGIWDVCSKIVSEYDQEIP